MSEYECDEFRTHTIVIVRHSDGSSVAKEVIVHRSKGEEIEIVPVPDTERILPLTLKEVEEWVNSLPGNMQEDERQVKIADLCSYGTLSGNEPM